MRMLIHFVLFLFVTTFMANYSSATPYGVKRRDMKLASQQLVEKQTILIPVIADVNRLLGAQATSNSVITTVTSFLAQPDVCRALSITPGGTTADVPAGGIVVSGLNIFGQAITETLTLTANQATIENGLKAFCSVSSVVFPIQDGAAATYDVGVIDVLGMKRCMGSVGHLLMSTFDGAFEATRATCVVDVDEVEKNTCDVNGTLDGAKDVELFFFQNYRCSP